MGFITLTEENIKEEHICCAFSDKKSVEGYEKKKEWLTKQFDSGYVFTKLDERAKVFIEYGPSEITYLPIDVENYMVINCFWVSGKYKNRGYGKQLLEKCIQYSKKKGKDGIAVLCSDKKRPFMSDKKFFIKQNFEKCDIAEPFFELYYYKLNDNAISPKFLSASKEGLCEDNGGFKVYYSHQCPYMDYYIDLQKEIAEERGIVYEKVLVDSKEKANVNPIPFTIYGLFYKGEFVTQELMAEKKFLKTIEKLIENN